MSRYPKPTVKPTVTAMRHSDKRSGGGCWVVTRLHRNGSHSSIKFSLVELEEIADLAEEMTSCTLYFDVDDATGDLLGPSVELTELIKRFRKAFGLKKGT